MAKILMFHRVLPEELITRPNAYHTFGTLISQKYLDKVLSMIIENGFQFATISDLTKLVETDNKVVLTFDDGYADNFDYALPVLQKYQATATFFPVVRPCFEGSVLALDTYYQCVDESELEESIRMDYISGNRKKIFYRSKPQIQLNLIKNWFPKVNPISRVNYLKKNQIKILSENGFEIGSHGMTHSLFTAEYMSENTIRYELTESKKNLEELIGKEVRAFCFPAGDYNETSIELVKDAGYTSVCLIKEKVTGCSFPAYKRIFVIPDSIEKLKSKLLEK